MAAQVVGSNPIRLSWGRSSAASRPSLPTATASAYPGYMQAAAYPGYGSGYAGSYAGLAGAQSTMADPYSAYAYALSQQANSMHPALYQVGRCSLRSRHACRQECRACDRLMAVAAGIPAGGCIGRHPDVRPPLLPERPAGGPGVQA